MRLTQLACARGHHGSNSSILIVLLIALVPLTEVARPPSFVDVTCGGSQVLPVREYEAKYPQLALRGGFESVRALRGGMDMAEMLGDPQIDHGGEIGMDPTQRVVSPQQLQQMQEEASQHEQARQALLSRIMHPKALARIANIAAANPQKARSLEDRFINSAREGQILEQVTEQDLVRMIGVSNRSREMKARVKFARRKSLLDSAGTDPEFAKRLGIDFSVIEGWDAELSEEVSASQYSDISLEEPEDTGVGGKDDDSDGGGNSDGE